MSLMWFHNAIVGQPMIRFGDRFGSSRERQFTHFVLSRDMYAQDIVIGGPLTVLTIFPVTIPPNHPSPLPEVRYLPTVAEDFVRYLHFYFTDSLGSRSFYYTLFGNSLLPAIKAISVQPLSIVFPDTKVNEFSLTRDVTIKNIGQSSTLPATLTISNIVVANHFQVTNLPTFPKELQVGETLDLKLRFAPTSQGDKSGSSILSIISDAPGSPHNVAAVAYCFLTASSPVSGLDSDTLMAFAFGAGPTIAVRKIDEYDLNCEEIQELVKVHDFNAPGLDKTLTDLFIKFEDMGAGQLISTISRRMLSSEQTVAQQRTISYGSSLADELPLMAKSSEYTLDGELLRLELYKEANSGPLSLIELILKCLFGAKLQGSFTLPIIRTFSPVVSPSGVDRAVAAFEGIEGITVGRFDATNLNCEEDCYWEKSSVFDMEGLEKAFMRLWAKCEDFGQVELSLQLTSPRGETNQEMVTFGGEEDERILNVAWNIIYSGEVFKLKMLKEADSGPVSLIGYNAKIEPRGELVE